jgi:hypothetical protein
MRLQIYSPLLLRPTSRRLRFLAQSSHIPIGFILRLPRGVLNRRHASRHLGISKRLNIRRGDAPGMWPILISCPALRTLKYTGAHSVFRLDDLLYHTLPSFESVIGIPWYGSWYHGSRFIASTSKTSHPWDSITSPDFELLRSSTVSTRKVIAITSNASLFANIIGCME